MGYSFVEYIKRKKSIAKLSIAGAMLSVISGCKVSDNTIDSTDDYNMIEQIPDEKSPETNYFIYPNVSTGVTETETFDNTTEIKTPDEISEIETMSVPETISETETIPVPETTIVEITTIPDAETTKMPEITTKPETTMTLETIKTPEQPKNDNCPNIPYGIYDEDKVTMTDLRPYMFGNTEMPEKFVESEKIVLSAILEGGEQDIVDCILNIDNKEFYEFMECWLKKYKFNFFYNSTRPKYDDNRQVKSINCAINVKRTKESIPAYYYKYNRYMNNRMIVDKIVDELDIKEGMSQKDALWLINNYICDLIDYDYDLYNKIIGKTDAPFVIQDILSTTDRKLGVCSDYAELFNEIANAVGINSYIVSGINNKTGIGHAWNIVEFSDGEQYIIDTTFNDSRSKYVRDDCFLIKERKDDCVATKIKDNKSEQYILVQWETDEAGKLGEDFANEANEYVSGFLRENLECLNQQQGEEITQ